MAKKKTEKFSDDQFAFAPRICNTGAQKTIKAPAKNSIHLDWLEFNCSNFNNFLGLVGLSSRDFQRIDNGLQGYPSQLRSVGGGIILLFDEVRGGKQKIIISGSGFDLIPHNDTEILNAVVEVDGVVQRLDVCLNVFNGGFTMSDVEESVYSGSLVTRFSRARPVKEFDLRSLTWRDGLTVYLGSVAGSRKVRIYDKKIEFEREHKIKLDFEWIRFELETRKRSAQTLFWRLVSGAEGIWAIPGIIRSVCDFRVPDPDEKNKCRWALVSWWADAVKNCSVIRCGLKKIKKSIEEKACWVSSVMNKTLAYVVGGKGAEWLRRVLRDGALKLSPEEIHEIQTYAGISFKPFREYFDVPVSVGRELVSSYSGVPF